MLQNISIGNFQTSLSSCYFFKTLYMFNVYLNTTYKTRKTTFIDTLMIYCHTCNIDFNNFSVYN